VLQNEVQRDGTKNTKSSCLSHAAASAAAAAAPSKRTLLETRLGRRIVPQDSQEYWDYEGGAALDGRE